MPARFVQTVVTSPPYFGLRDYDHPEQSGLEPSPDQYVANLVAVFREVRRVLSDDGTVWLNLGDSYARNPRRGGDGSTGKNPHSVRSGSSDNGVGRADRYGPFVKIEGLPEKSLIGIPWRVAFALQADGWTLRDEIIWSKPNAMPGSQKDRCTRSHEHIFMFSKNGRYYYDQEAIKEPAIWYNRSVDVKKGGFNGKYPETFRAIREFRTKRSVWSVSTQGYKGAHFATFPANLIEPCILAGAPVGGVVLDPFAGSGTTGMVARRNRREAVLIELNPDYVPMIRDRLK